MKKLILVLVMALGMLSCTKEKLDNTKCGPIVNKGMAGNGSIWIVVRLSNGDVEMTVWAPTIYNYNPDLVYNSYKIGETYCKP